MEEVSSISPNVKSEFHDTTIMSIKQEEDVESKQVMTSTHNIIKTEIESLSQAQPVTAPFSSRLSITTHVAGSRHYLKSTKLQPTIHGGIKLGYLREPNNPRDPHAIRLFLPESNLTSTSPGVIPAEDDAIMKEDEEGNVSSELKTEERSNLLKDNESSTEGTNFGPTIGHLPAILARKVSPLLEQGLILLQICICDAQSPAEETETSERTEPTHPSSVPPNPASAATPAALKYPRIDILVDIHPIHLSSHEESKSQNSPFSLEACTLWLELEELISVLAATSYQTYDQRLVQNFDLVARTTLIYFHHLFLEEEIAVAHEFLSLPFETQRFYLRLFNRVRPHRWFQLSSLRLPFEINEPIQQLSSDPNAHQNQPAIDPIPSQNHVLISPSKGFSLVSSATPTVRTPPTPPTPLIQRSSTCPDMIVIDDEDEVVVKKEVIMSPHHIDSSSSTAPPFSTAASPTLKPFVTRVSQLSLDQWSKALPSLLTECTIPMIKELIQALGLKNKLGQLNNSSNQTSASLKEMLISHLTNQRTLFASTGAASLTSCPKARATIMNTCGDFIQLSPVFLSLLQRVHRLFFLQNDPTEPSPMKLEELGLFRWFKSPTLTHAFEQARIRMELDGNTTGATMAPSIKRELETDPPRNWCLFPTRAVFLAYDTAVQFFIHMYQVCESVLLTGEARKLYGVFTMDQALQLLTEAKKRFDAELIQPNSLFLSSPFTPASIAASTKTVTIVTPSGSFFQRARVAKSKSSSSTTSTATSSTTFFTDITYDRFVPYQTVASASSTAPIVHSFNDDSELHHPFLSSYRAISIYASCIHYGIKVLERAKRYTEANSMFLFLLSHPYLPHRRGSWWNRLLLNLEAHFKENSIASKLSLIALDDLSRNPCAGDWIELQTRVRRLWKHHPSNSKLKTLLPCPIDELPDYSRSTATTLILGQDKKGRGKKRKNSFNANESVSSTLVDLDETYSSVFNDGITLSLIFGTPTNCETGIHSRFYDSDNEACRVEDLCLSYFARPEYGSYTGRHDEGEIFHALFALLMWDVIFSDLPQVWQTQYQNAPLDFGTTHFYSARQDLIHSTLTDLLSDTDGELTARLQRSWTTNHGTSVRGLNWRQGITSTASADPFEPPTTARPRPPLTLEILLEVITCLPREALVHMCLLLSQNYSIWSGGLPDLCLWRPGTTTSRRCGVTLEDMLQSTDFRRQLEGKIKLEAFDSNKVIKQESASSPQLPKSLVKSEPLTLSSTSKRSSSSIDLICISSDDEELISPSVKSIAKSTSLPPNSTTATNSRLNNSNNNKRRHSEMSEVKSELKVLTQPGQSSTNSRKKKTKPDPSLTTPIKQQSMMAFTAISPRFQSPPFETTKSESIREMTDLVDGVDDDFLEDVTCVDTPLLGRLKSMDGSRATSKSSTATNHHLASPSTSLIDSNTRPHPSSAFASNDFASSIGRLPSASSPFPSLKLVEVKGPNDRLSYQQIGWLQVLSRYMHVEVCYVNMVQE